MSIPICIFCFTLQKKLNESDLVDSTAYFKVISELEDLKFVVILSYY